VTETQLRLARHALGFPNERNISYRNHFCTGKGSDHHADWENMVAQGFAVKRTGPYWGGDDMFHLTLKGALLARNPKEHLSPEDTKQMREMESA
jgi:hypothetical protein